MRLHENRLIRFLRDEPLETVVWRTPLITGLVALVCLAAVAAIRTLGRPHKGSMDVLYISLGALGLSLILAPVLKYKARRMAPTDEARQRTLRVCLLAFQAGAVLLLFPALLRSWRSDLYDLRWLAWGFQDRRYIFALYWIAMGSVIFLPVGIHALLYQPAAELPISDSVLPNSAKERWRILLAGLGKLLLAFSVAWFFAGPPWNLEDYARYIDVHEHVHLGPLQAIKLGATPYLGPASIQYGPGFQLFQHVYMENTGTYSVVGLRETFALACLAGLVLFCAIVFLYFNPWLACLTTLLALQFSPFAMFGWNTQGSLAGFYGWANPLRYMGGIMLVFLLPWLLERAKRGNRLLPSAAGTGAVWGVLVYFAPENLSCGLAGGTFLLAILWSAGHAHFKAILRVVLNLLLGFLLVWIVPLAYYASHGALGEFLHNFFLVPSLVPRGFSNTRYLEGMSHRTSAAFYLTPLFLAIVGVSTLFDLRQRRLRARLEPAHVRLLAALAAVIACYPTALFRSDALHLLNVMAGLPILAVAFLHQVPSLFHVSGPKRWWIWSLGFVFLALLYPFNLSIFLSPYEKIIQPPLQRFAADRPKAAPLSSQASVVEQRLGAPLCALPTLFNSGPSAQETISNLEHLRLQLTDRTVLIHKFPHVYQGVIYFVADLKPAPVLLDQFTMVVHEGIRDRDLAHMAKHIDAFGAIVSTDLENPYIQTFKRLVPDSETLQSSLNGSTYYIVRRRHSDPAGRASDVQLR